MLRLYVQVLVWIPAVWMFRITQTAVRNRLRSLSSVSAVSATTKYEELMNASTLSLAPMMDYTDRHFRHLVRLVSNRTMLYTEMIAANALAHERNDAREEFRRQHPWATEEHVRRGYRDDYLRRYLGQSKNEGPCVLQLGGSDPQQLYDATKTVLELTERGVCDYTALNLNCGCPSPKVAGKGCFGAALMQEPHLVAELVKAMDEAGQGLPISVKCRIGTDLEQGFRFDQPVDSVAEYDRLCRFVDTVSASGVVKDFCVHARIAVLQRSYSPKENRNIPPLKYHYVKQLTTDFPHLSFTLNGGIDSISHVQTEMENNPGLKGVMIGRAFASDPWRFAMADQLLYGEARAAAPHRWHVLQEYCKHADYEESNGDPLKIRRFIIKAVSSLFTGEANAKRFRIALDEIGAQPKRLAMEGKSMVGQPLISQQLLRAAGQFLSEEALFSPPEGSYQHFSDQSKVISC